MTCVKITSKSGRIPKKHSAGASGFDVEASLGGKDIMLMPGKVQLIPTGIRLSMPEGLECQVRSRSGLALKHGVFVLNAPGTVDADYRGEVGVILANFGNEPFVVKDGMRIAQLVFCQVPEIDLELVSDDELDQTERGDGGFGSTGINQGDSPSDRT